MTDVQQADSPRVMNRWLVVVGAILIQLCLGAIYAWSVFTPALTADTRGAVVAVYDAKHLEVDAQKLETLRESIGLKEQPGPVKEIAKLKGQLSKASKEEKKALEKEIDALTRQVDAMVAAAVKTDKIDSLISTMGKPKAMAVFAAGLASFAGVMFLFGMLLPKVKMRTRAMIGSIALGAGYVLAGFMGPTSFPVLLIFIGILGGAGIGMAYVVPIAIGMAWFPDKKGLITGLAVAGFGFGAMLWVKLAGAWGHLIETMGIGQVFIIYGIVFAVACLIGSVWMVKPPKGWKPQGWEPPAPAGDGQAAAGSVDYKLSQMLGKPQAYMIFLCFLFGAAAGLMSIGLMKLFPMEALEANGIEAAKASAIAGTAMAVFFSLANGIGRIVWGAISDKLGYKLSVFIMLATQGVFVILFQWVAGQEYLLYVFATLIGFNFGGNFALFPVATADTFGKKFIAQNYGFIFLSYGVGGIFGPMMGGYLGKGGDFPMAFTICGGLCLIAAVIAFMIRPPKHA